MVIIHADMKVLPEKREVFLQQTQGLISASQAEEGNVRYTLMQDLNDPNAFTMVEEWKDAAAVDFHNKSAHFQTFVAAAKELLAAPLQVNAFQDATKL
ncbi:putative quinol monooxygenase [Paenibacillus kribbensis]|uniref:putative quinol monooxygenase n=1 Tax=Paenibacillus kribbensis TaxID=172713 RepID=UPI002DB59886|nr:putative quinol monooxygenase [Paenibacillus kribbensis]MEC0232766.1 putative quinol monooxygenase [Paenibacillus kribbensis]